MANKSLFRSVRGKLLPKARATNRAGGRAYAFSPAHALAQYAATGCLHSTFYASARLQLETILELCEELDPVFIAKAALYAREKSHMKDLPALLLAVLAHRDGETFPQVFSRIADHPKMLRTFVQILRSGVVGRKSLGSRPKRLVRQWLESRSEEQLLRASVGRNPSLADIVKMVHPKPSTPAREAFYGYLLGRPVDRALLPPVVGDLEAFRDDPRDGFPPDVPMQLLTSLPLQTSHWVTIASRASWQVTRQSLNTFLRHGVFDHPGMIETIANRLRDPSQISRARALPYQLFAAWRSASDDLPNEVLESLRDAMEVATSNAPALKGKVFVLVDISGSMHSPITGSRNGCSSVMRCLDVAALFASTLLRNNPETRVIPYESDVVQVWPSAEESIMSNAELLGSFPGGGTNSSAPLRYLNEIEAQGDLVIYLSDNESWLDSTTYGSVGGTATQTLGEWKVFKERNPEARLVCIDLQPNSTTQAQERRDILNIGGFSDQVFALLGDFAAGRTQADFWVRTIENISIEDGGKSEQVSRMVNAKGAP